MSSRSLTPRTPRVGIFFPASDMSAGSSSDKKNNGDFEPQKLDKNKQREELLASKSSGECGDCVSRGREMAIHLANLESKLSDEIDGKNILSSALEVLERTVSERDKEIEILKFEKRELEFECEGLREQLEITTKHLNTIEISFNDVHEKYERAKTAIQILNQNIDILKESISERDSCISQKNEQYSKLKKHAMERMDHANSQLDLIERKYSLESSKLRAAVKDAELGARSLSEQLEQRNKEKGELTSICDGLIEKMEAQKNSAIVFGSEKSIPHD